MNTQQYLSKLLLILLLLVACNSPGATSTPNESPSVTLDSKPTSTPAPPPTPSPTPVVQPVPTPARQQPTPTALPTQVLESPIATIPSSFVTYTDNTFGFSIRYPETWNIQDTLTTPRLATIVGPTEQSGDQSLIRGVVSLVYNRDNVSADAVADTLLPPLMERDGFRTTNEQSFKLANGSDAFQIAYQWRTENGFDYGLIQTNTRGSHSFVLLLEAPESSFEQSKEEIHLLFQSLNPSDPSPVGLARNDTLTLYLDDGPVTLDPAVAQESRSIRYISQIFSGLVSFDRDLNLQPELAEGWEIGGDGTIYTFTLKENAKFHDGRPVIAADIKFSWERAAGLRFSSTVGTYLNDIVGVDSVIKGDATEISGVTVVDDATLEVTIDAPKAYFLSKLSHPLTYIVDRKNIVQAPETTTPWWAHPNGTGPFKLNTWEPNRLMVLDANQSFYNEPPAIPHLVFKLYGGVPTHMYEHGEIDMARVYPDELREIQSPGNTMMSDLLVTPLMSINYIGLVASKPPFDDPLVRKAFLLAIDRQQLVANIYGDSRELANGFLPPGLPGHNTSIKGSGFDPVEARRLLRNSSYGGPEGLPEIVYITTGFSEPSAVVTAILAMWRTNLDVNVQATLIRDAYYYALPLALDIANIYDYGWIADYPDPHNFLDVLFHSNADNNVGGYSNAEVDTLLERARTEQQETTRLELYEEVERILIEEASAIPLYFGKDFFLVKPFVQNPAFSPFGTLNFGSMSLAKR
ncbi:MAG: peptide ABC transporter substrate-binding protein [Chloroflexota bacterium]|nr:peptide ABC transporter substrate-binding protein [Chloroflexota bacterium]